MINYLLFIACIPVGFFLDTVFMRAGNGFGWAKYFFIFLIPTIGLINLCLYDGPKILVFFLVMCVIGPLSEATVGLTYLRVAGRHLWLYERLPLFNRTTSYLSILFWGFVSTGVYCVERVVSLLVVR